MLSNLITRLDAAVQLGDTAAITGRIKRELESAIHARGVTLPERFHRTRADGYARRLLHRSDTLGYTAVVMTLTPARVRFVDTVHLENKPDVKVRFR